MPVFVGGTDQFGRPLIGEWGHERVALPGELTHSRPTHDSYGRPFSEYGSDGRPLDGGPGSIHEIVSQWRYQRGD